MASCFLRNWNGVAQIGVTIGAMPMRKGYNIIPPVEPKDRMNIP